MQQSDAGKGHFKLILTLLFLAAVAFFAFKTIPVYVNNYELNDDIRELAIQATASHSSADAVQNQVLQDAKGLGLPVTPEEVNVTAGNGGVSIDVDYKVPIDLKVYVWVWELKDSTSNKAI
jgi:YbbR domain-containing protein